jgi:uncharacterized protein (DUF1800 family)
MVERIEKPPGQQQLQDRPITNKKLTDPAWAWAQYQSDSQQPWNLIKAGHLFRRAAFGADWNQLQQALSDGPQRTIDKLLKPQADTKTFNNTYDEYENSTAGSIKNLKAWWLRRMMQTPYPLLEKITLFWHSHFATKSDKVKDPKLMLRYIRLLRSQALNSFREMLQAISNDPAMLTWLGADKNRKALPNDKFVRPLMETFTLGPGNYTEKDIKEAARAFTGWFVLRSQLRYFTREHDSNTKNILGQKGNFNNDDVVRIVLKQPATSQMIVKKLYRWLICESKEPDTILITPLAESFAKDYDIMKLTETMLRSNLFFSQSAYRQRIKSPVEFALSIVKPLEGIVSTTQLAKDLINLGQDLYNPPTVNGWTGGQHWINNAALIGRHNLASALIQGSKPYADKLNPWTLSNKYGHSIPKTAAKFLLDLLLQGDLTPAVYNSILKPLESPSGDNNPERILRNFVQTLIVLPEFHLA